MIYDKFANDIYWNSDRIINSLDDWFIYVKVVNGNHQGTIYYINDSDGLYEIFGVDFVNNKYNSNLKTY